MDPDEDLSASTYTFDSSPTAPSASATPGSGAFIPRGAGHTTLGPPSALSILLARGQQGKGSRELLGGEQVSSETGHEGASALEYSTSQVSVTPTNGRPGNAYFSSVAADAPHRLGSRLATGPHPAATGEEAEQESPDLSPSIPDETTSLLRANHTTFHYEDVNNGSRLMFKVTKTPQLTKPVTPRGYDSILFLSKPSETFRRILDPNLGRKAFRAIPAVVLGTLLNVLDGISCTCFYLQLVPHIWEPPKC